MKLAHLNFLILSAATLPGVEVKLRFLDDERRPLARVAATAIFVKSNPRDDFVREGLSDPAGLFVARESADGGISIRARREDRFGIEYQRLAPGPPRPRGLPLYRPTPPPFP